jgi:hypothetical protein
MYGPALYVLMCILWEHTGMYVCISEYCWVDHVVQDGCSVRLRGFHYVCVYTYVHTYVHM